MNTKAAIPELSKLPPVLDVREAHRTFKMGKTTLYALAAAGEIQSLTLGAPGSRGKRVFLTESLLDYVTRRIANSPRLTTGQTGNGGKA